MKKVFLVISIFFLISVLVFSGCINSLPTDEECKQRIKEETGCNYIVLEQWKHALLSSKREFTAYSYNPDDPANEGIIGGWVSGYIDSDGNVEITFQS